MNTNIRKAVKSDLKAIHQLVYELAVYEKAPAEMVASIKDYEQDFDQGWFEALIATTSSEVVGIALYYNTYSTWKGKMVYLEDFVVKQAHRKMGIGQLLFDAFIVEAKKKGAKLIKWQVLDWNEPALNFYHKNKAIIEKEWWNGKIFLESIKK